MDGLLKVRLEIISPVHIGCDDVYEPTNFVIDEDKHMLINFDPIDLINNLDRNEKKELENVSMEDDLLKIFKFLKKSYKTQVGGRSVDITASLINQYRKILGMVRFDKKVVINQFEISRTSHNKHTGIPYIPGSSLKGSLRTAYLSKEAKNNGIKKWWEKSSKPRRDDLRNPMAIEESIKKYNLSKELEEKLLNGKFSTDPFRLVKISDLEPVSKAGTKILYAVNKKKKLSRYTAGGPYQILETIQQGEVFEGVINIQKAENGSGIHSKISKEKILNSLNSFYKSVCEAEDENTLKSIDCSSHVMDILKTRYKQSIGKTAFPIRIGRHSGAESVTIEDNRHIKITQGRGSQPKFLDHATTIWLASDSPNPANNNNLVPFGWAMLTIGEYGKAFPRTDTEDNRRGTIEENRKATPEEINKLLDRFK